MNRKMQKSHEIFIVSYSFLFCLGGLNVNKICRKKTLKTIVEYLSITKIVAEFT